jgi:hypothetical protein
MGEFERQRDREYRQMLIDAGLLIPVEMAKVPKIFTKGAQPPKFMPTPNLGPHELAMEKRRWKIRQGKTKLARLIVAGEHEDRAMTDSLKNRTYASYRKMFPL